MIDLYLKLPSKADLEAALTNFRGKDVDDIGTWKNADSTYTLDVIGDDYENDGKIDEAGNITKERTKKDGYFAMLRCSQEVADLIPQEIIWKGVRPNRVWFKKDSL